MADKYLPAFPVTSDNYANLESVGMTLRDYFAAKALQGLIMADSSDYSDRNRIAEKAYDFADAMLVARVS
jgi:hypothetical protein